jgi:mRNA-degrading endonuclease RelE of RelBE toxin-antitoxin system
MGAYRILRTPPFDADVARLTRKFPKLASHLDEFFAENLATAPRRLGTPVGRNPHFWKARIGIPSAGISKRDGLRLIYRIQDQHEMVVPLTLYHKAEKRDVTDAEIKRAVEATRPHFEQELRKRGIDPTLVKL